MNCFRHHAKTIDFLQAYPGLILIPIGKEKEREEIYFMNKYSKRALKTTATVGMSLAMVLSAAAPVMAAMDGYGVCAAESAALTGKECGRAVFAELFEETITDHDMDSSLTIEIPNASDNGVDEVNAFYAVNEFKNELKAYAATLSLTDAKKVNSWVKAAEDINGMFDKAFDTTKTLVLVGSGAAGVAGADETLVSTDIGEVGKTAKELVAGGKYADADAMKLNKTAAKDTKKALDDYANETKGSYKYLSGDLKDIFDSVKADFDEIYEEAIGTSTDKELAEFVIAFDKILTNDIKGNDTKLTKGQAEMTGYGSAEMTLKAVNLASKSALNTRIKNIKEADLYDSVKDEDSVIALIEGYEAILDELAGNSDLTKEGAYVDYMKTKTDAADKTVKVAIDAMGIKTAKDLERAKAIAKDLDNEQFEILKALKEDVLDVLVELKTRQIGNYHVDDSSWSKTVVSTQKTTITKNVAEVFTTLVDTEDGLFGYDVVANHMADFNEALKAVTTDIEKVTPANIKAADKAKLEAAEDAYYELTDKGKFVNNLTTKEARLVRAADRKLMNLREAFDNLGTTTATGWYDKGNGNWGYNNEDGTAATKWVAAGSDWYYVKGGNMLRNSWVAQDATGAKWYYVDNAGKMVSNTTIDGFVIDANGVWTK